MNKIIVTFLTGIVAFHSASATLIDSFYTSADTDIPDANPSGVTFSHTTTTANSSYINGVDVRLDITGGFNGDLYGYLVFQPTDNSASTMAILLNRVGRTSEFDLGSSVSGMSVVLSSAGLAGNIHDASIPSSTYGTPSTYYGADTRTTSPFGDFSGATPAGSALSVFNSFNHDANGTWTLFLADLSGGDVSRLVGWGLDISVVPEPTTLALGLFVAGFGAVAGMKFYSGRRKSQS